MNVASAINAAGGMNLKVYTFSRNLRMVMQIGQELQLQEMVQTFN